MRIVVRHACVSPDRAPFDVAERKGIGHPDSLADLVADTFSQRYAAWCLQQFGVVPNHWVDKVNLVGATAEVSFGGFTIQKPIDCYLFGKVTDSLGSIAIPVDALFYESVVDVLTAALDDGRVVDHLRLHVNNTRGVAVDHDPQFYLPEAAGSLTQVLASESGANDTVICVGGGRRGLAGDLAVRLEQHITGATFRGMFPAVGTDVKVMVVRVGADLDITVAVPIHPEAVASFAEYRTCLTEVQTAVYGDLKTLLNSEPRARAVTAVALHLNTKDAPGRGYLAPFGTSLGKGDCGVVGRGNRYSGAIEPLRPASCEAPAGKNPMHHVGKIYTAIAAETARHVMAETSLYAEVTIAARNGGRLDEPAFVLVALDHLPGTAVTAEVERLVRHHIAGAADFAARFLATDTVGRFRDSGDQ